LGARNLNRVARRNLSTKRAKIPVRQNRDSFANFWPNIELFRQLCRQKVCWHPTLSAEKSGKDGARKSTKAKMLWRGRGQFLSELRAGGRSWSFPRPKVGAWGTQFPYPRTRATRLTQKSGYRTPCISNFAWDVAPAFSELKASSCFTPLLRYQPSARGSASCEATVRAQFYADRRAPPVRQRWKLRHGPKRARCGLRDGQSPRPSWAYRS